MKAPIRSVLAVIAGCMAFALAGLSANAAMACCTAPPPPPADTCGCHHQQHHQGVNQTVNVKQTLKLNVVVKTQTNTNVKTNTNTNVNTRVNAAGSASGFGSSFVGGGGGGGGASFTTAPVEVVEGLRVEGGEAHSLAYEASRTRIRKMIIQAVCLDDKDVPHPASQVTPDREIEESYEGELYRCIAGTRMQATIAEYNGQIVFDHGQIMACEKNQALYRDHDGHVECRVQRPARDCNERSLLRRFGAGIKIVTMVTVEKYTAYREERSSSVSSGNLSLNGGVGGVAF